MWNSTEDPSSIRFGGYNEELFATGHKQRWINTTSNTQWHIDLDSVEFNGEDLLPEKMTALINPGYPFIAMPVSAFEKFKKDLMDAYPDEPVTCTSMDWCYFFTPCDKLRDDMPDIKMGFKTNDVNEEGVSEVTTYNIKPLSFLYADVDYRTNITTCHLGVIGQKYNDNDHWVLGGAFMENFYVTFDAMNPQQLRVGLSYEYAEEKKVSNIVMLMCLLLIGFLIVVTIVLGICVCCRNRKLARLARAKTFFDTDTLKENSENDPEAKFLESSQQDTTTVNERKAKKQKKNKDKSTKLVDSDEEIKKFNPNSFISSTSFDDEEQDDGDEVSSQEALDQVPALTSNEQAVGELI